MQPAAERIAIEDDRKVVRQQVDNLPRNDIRSCTPKRDYRTLHFARFFIPDDVKLLIRELAKLDDRQNRRSRCLQAEMISLCSCRRTSTRVRLIVYLLFRERVVLDPIRGHYNLY